MLKKVHILLAVRGRQEAIALCRMLDDEEHCSIHLAGSGKETLAAAAQLVPDILVIDALLPDMDGLGVLDALRAQLGDRMPRVIGGSMMPFTDRAFALRGVSAVLRVPWDMSALREEIQRQIAELDAAVDWRRAQEEYERACALLAAMGMHDTLKGFTYLAWAAALAHQNEARLYGVGRRLYQPIAERFHTTPQSVERLIRHAVERTMDAAKGRGVYGFFGNTIDPKRGKPTNAQIVGMLVQRMRVEHASSSA